VVYVPEARKYDSERNHSYYEKLVSFSYNVLHYVNIALGSGAAERSLKARACQKGCT